MLKGLHLLLFTTLCISHTFSQDRIYFFGHAYGKPALIDHKMDPSILSFLEEDYTKVVYGGDFIYDTNDQIEIENFVEFNKKRNFVLIPGNHDVNSKLFNHQENRFELVGNNLLVYLNTNFNNINEVQNSVDFLTETIRKNIFKNVLIFSHQLFYSKSNFDIRTNSRENYELTNLFYDEIYEYLININKNIFIYSGDIGAFRYTPYCYYNQIENISFYSSGLGNGLNNYCIEISIDKKNNISNYFVDLKTKKRLDPLKFNRWKVRLYQLPKLVLYEIKQHYLIILIVLVVLLGMTLFKKRKLI